jgi:hypothetical protein
MRADLTAVLNYAINNDGVVTRREALALGISPRTLDRRVDDRVLIKVAPGVYALPGALQSNRSTLRAATRALGAVVSHQAAAWTHGVHIMGRSLVVSVPHRKTHQFHRVVVHQLTDIRPDDVIYFEGLPVTSAARTAVDLAAVISPQALGRSLDELVRLKRTTNEEVDDLLGILARKGKPGVINLRRVLDVRLERTGVSESELERRLLDVIERAGLPTPDLQYRPDWLRSVNGRVDMSYPDALLVIEGDSRGWHGDEATFQSDRERDNLAQLAGWRILRFTWTDITNRPSYVASTVRSALANTDLV